MAANFWNARPEPNRQFRWIINFSKEESLKPVVFALKKASRPTIKVGEITHKYLNHFYYYPGRVEWEPITVSFAQIPITEATAAQLQLVNTRILNVLQNSGYSYPNAPNNEKAASVFAGTTNTNRQTISKETATTAVDTGGGVSLSLLNSTGAPVQTWYLFNTFFTDVKFDTLEYGSEEVLNLDCTIRYDYATLKQDATSFIE